MVLMSIEYYLMDKRENLPQPELHYEVRPTFVFEVYVVVDALAYGGQG